MKRDSRDPEELSIEELEQLLYRKKRAHRQQRLLRLKAEGRVVEANGIAPPDPLPEAPVRPEPRPLQEYILEGDEVEQEVDEEPVEPAEEEEEGWRSRLSLDWRWMANKLLLLVEVGAVVGLVVLAIMVWATSQELNRELAEVQEAQSVGMALPTASPTPVIGVVVLPSGHKPPVNGRPPEEGEAGEIPAHLLPIIDAYVPPPIPTPGPEQARRIQVPAIGVDKPIVQGDDWEQLKKGVGQHIGSALPGRDGNLVLSAHNDIYGEIFRNLDKLKPGDEIIISTERQQYTYVVRDLEVVEPTDVSVMAQTEHSSITLISCYPYLVNNKRIVIFADLATTGPLAQVPSQ